MSKTQQLHVNMAFTADTTQAAQQIKSLQQSLTKLINQPVPIGQKMTESLAQATHAAAELKVHLQAATNVQTGNLDFGKLNQSLKASGTTLSQYAAKIASIGPQGQQAFMQLARSVAMAEVPMRRANASLQSFATSLANTARWQISSSALHAFIGAVSTAWNYSQDLNESLNNIRIVTGKNIDEMARFADQANRAAKALSTTTTEYTNASLIYYQQGLTDAEVLGRTETTIKMANASRQSAKIVSDQMTAIWNNFYNGSKSLEYYADVVTALGAATASSSEEIATGLEKFASVAETVGLSYEYATAALATVTATTRQSADVVGTAFKTLFARLNDLKLGETLDDGTTLGQYTQNLAKVGVSIKDASGELKDMDQILNETAAKWQTLDRAQQTALAKGVAGIRQYSQFIALMDNWDFMEQNLQTAKDASGTLSEQASIYEESWEAASKRVKASLEDVYSSIMDDEFFIQLTDGFAGLIDIVGGFIKSIGGLRGVLSGLGLVLTKVFSAQMAEGFRNMAYNISMNTGIGRSMIQNARTQELHSMTSMMEEVNMQFMPGGEQSKRVYTDILSLQQEMVKNADRMTEAERQKNQILLDQFQTLSQQSIELAKQLDLQKERATYIGTDIKGNMMIHGTNDKGSTMNITQASQALQGFNTDYIQKITQVSVALAKIGSSSKIAQTDVTQLQAAIKNLRTVQNIDNNIVNQMYNLASSFDTVTANAEITSSAISNINALIRMSDSNQISGFLTNKAHIGVESEIYQEITGQLQNYINTLKQAGILKDRLTTSNVGLSNSFKTLTQSLQNAGIATQDWANHLSTIISGLMSLGMLMSSVSGLMDTISNPDLTGWERWSQLTMSLSMTLMSLIGTYKMFAAAKNLVIDLTKKDTLVTLINESAKYLQDKEEARRALADERKARRQAKKIGMYAVEAPLQKQAIADEQSEAVTTEAGAKAQAHKNEEDKEALLIRAAEQKMGLSHGKGQYYQTHGKVTKTLNKKQYNAKLTKGKQLVEAEGGVKSAPTTITPTKTKLNAGSLKTVGSWLAGVAIAAASVAIAVTAISKASEHYHRYEKAADAAEEASSRLAKSLSEVQEAESQFRNNVTGYLDTKKSLDELTEGTTEYGEAISEANKQALELLKTHKELEYTIDQKTGLIEIAEEDLNKAKAKGLADEKRALATSLAAEQSAKTKRLEADKVQFTRDQAKSGKLTWDNDDTTIAAGAGVAAGALGIGGGLLAAGAVNGWNPVGWVLLAAGALTALVGGAMMLFNNDAQEIEQQTLEAIAEKRQELGRDLTDTEIKEIAIKYDDTGELGKSLTETAIALNKTNEMAEAINENTAAVRKNSEAILGQQYGGAAAEWMVDSYSRAYDKKKAELEYLNTTINRTEDLDGKSEASQFIAEYEKLTGKKLDWDKNVAVGNDKNREFLYHEVNPETGKKEEKKLSYTDMIEEMAVAYALGAQNKEYEKVREMLVNIEGMYGMNIANALGEWTTSQKFGDNLTIGNFKTMQQDIKNSGSIEEYLEQTYGMPIENIVKELNYRNTEELIKSFNTAIVDYEEEINSASKKIPDAVKDSFKNFVLEHDGFKNISASVYASITEPLQKAYAEGGEAGYEIMESLLASAVNETELQNLAQIFTETDWNAASVEDLQKKIKELGINSTFTSSQLDSLISLMKDGVVSVGNIGKNYASLMESLDKSTLTVSAEQYTQLAEKGLSSYFTYMYDGTYKLVGAAEDFQDVLTMLMQQEYTNLIRDGHIRLQEIEASVKEKKIAIADMEERGTLEKALSTDLVFSTYTDGKVKRQGHYTKEYIASQYPITNAKDGDQVYSLAKTKMSNSVNNVRGAIQPMQWDDAVYAAYADIYGKPGQVVQQYTDSDGKQRAVTVNDKALSAYNARIDFIEAMDVVGDDLIEQWRSSSDMVATEKEIVETYLPQAIARKEELDSLAAVQKAAILQAEEALLSTAKDSEQRKAMYEQDNLSSQSYAKAVNAAITEESWEGLNQEEVAEYADYLKNSFDIAEEESEEVSRAIAKMNKGIQELNDNWEDWSSILKTSSKSSQEYSKAMQGTRKALSDVLDVSEEFIDVDFIQQEENLKLIGEAAEGDAEAIDKLAIALAQDIALDALQKQLDLGKTINIDGIDYVGEEAKNKIITMMNELSSLMDGSNLTVGDKIDSGPLFAKMQDIIAASAMTAEEANAYYRSMGFTPHFKMVDAIQAESVPITTTYHSRKYNDDSWDENGNLVSWVDTEYSETTQVPGGELHTALPSMTTETHDGKMPQVPSTEITSVTYTGGGSFNNLSSSNPGGKKGGGGSSSKPKKTSEAKKKKSEVVDRYKEINDQLDDTQNVMDKASKAADRLYGPKRLKEMEKINNALQTEIKQLKEKRKEAEQYLKIDQQDLNKAASALNISFTFDNGNIFNYEEAMTSVYNKREALLKSFGSTINEKEQEQLDALDKKIEELKAAIEQYDETRELTEDLDNEIQDAVNEWQDNNYEQLTYKLELQVEINDRDLEVLEYYLSKTKDDFYKQAEGIGYLTQQVGIYNDKLEDNQNHLADLQQKYNDGNISQSDYIEGLKEIFSATVADAQALADLDKQMLEYYGNTLDMASEEISKYTERMEHQTSVLEHFKNIMDIIGESTNYEALGVILEGQAQAIENELKVARETYDFYSNEAIKKKDLMDRAIASGDTKAAELYRKEWEAAEAAAREAQDNMLSKTEGWAEAMKAILENKLAGLAQTLENALTGGTSFDTIATQMERAASLQEEYLTSTNKIYETNKLINTAQKEIDKTTNTVAKKRLKSFQEETAQLQNKSKLSQYELDIQQAKYELLLAEIALEEAQQAKSTVRLQRDSEGNFGYVYTADANAVADAEQKLADAQNNLYNIGLDGANDYAQKYQQIMQEMTDTLKDITEKYRNGEYESEEEYHQAMEDAKAYYFQKLQDYSNLYQAALTTDSRVIADAWSTDFGIMTTKTEDWKKAVNKYLSEVNGAFEGWEKVVKRVKAETVGQDLDALKDKTQAIVDVSADLSEQITKKGGVIDSIEAEMAAVSAITSTYVQWGQAIAATIAANEKLMHQTNAIIAEESGGKSSVSSKDGNLKTDNKDKSNATTGATGASENNNISSKQPSLADGSKVTVKKTAHHFSRDGGNGTKMQDWVPGYTFTVIDTDGNEVLIGRGSSYSQATGWVRKTDLEGFKTGGYTGSWGSEGKLAMLHQKELILNADDTANFLASLEILREIINVIDLHSAHAQLSGLLSSPAYRDYNEPQTLEQQVHIEASFPNVQDRHEIEDAFNNLINRAAQFVNRK